MFGAIGRRFILAMGVIGQIALFLLESLKATFTRPFYIKETMHQLFRVGFLSLPIVTLTAVFTGIVLALQTYTGFSRFGATGAVPTVIVLSIVRELGPVLTGLMIAGRVGAAMAAEVGTMTVTDQIDAMRTLHTDPYHYLIAPRILASVISLPLLVLVADTIGVYGGFLISTLYLDFNESYYITQTFQFLYFSDVFSGLFKALFFGAAISTIGCYTGYTALLGAEGVGIAATKSVVLSSISIFVLNYILTILLF
ncbi:MAG: ABC transporter permease [Alphaproteobacteria bacterium]|nr:ABC transporter permease [Alphaproteobacteria bacterium]